MEKTCRNILWAALISVSLAAGCVEEAQPVKNEAPRVDFTMPDGTITAAVGESVDFSADIVAGERLNCGWYIDGVLEASTASFSYVFEKPGTYEVRFEARNGSGSESHTYKVEVADRLSVSLSVGDSTVIERVQDGYLKVMAIVEHGENVEHKWKVTDAEGTELYSYTEAYFDRFRLEELTTYTVSYSCSNAAGSWSRSFDVKVLDKPLNIVFSIPEGNASTVEGAEFRIDADVLSGAEGLVHSWSVDGKEVSQAEDFVYTFDAEGSYAVSYKGVNAKNETVEAAWTVEAASSGTLLDDFEGELESWWTTGENSPGISIVDNPYPSGINTSGRVLIDKVSGSGSTSGYFTLKTGTIAAESGIDVSRFTGIRFKIYLGNNRYYPRVHIGDVKYTPVSSPQFSGEWEVLEYRFDFNFDPYKNIVFRLMLDESGNNISGSDPNNNDRTVYIDDIEFLP